MAKKAANTPNQDSAQLSLFDDLLAQLNNAGGKISSDQIAAVIGKLTSARDRAKKREAQEKKQKAEEEAARKRFQQTQSVRYGHHGACPQALKSPVWPSQAC